jgi:hypothetical protein
VRPQLQLFVGCKYPFSATVRNFGLRKVAYRGDEPTVCLRDVLLHSGTVIVPIDHVWANVVKTFAQFNPEKGDRICFNAWIIEYYKYNYNTGEDRLDYCIERLSKLDHIEHSCSGADFADFWSKLKQSGRFITDRIEVPCTTRVSRQRKRRVTGTRRQVLRRWRQATILSNLF